MSGELKDLDTNTLVYIIDYIDNTITKEKSFMTQWKDFGQYQERIRTLEDMLKYMKYLHTMSKEISL